MRFPFIVKHNGTLYPAGKEVPIGKEPKVENQIEDKTASELSKELEERFGIKMAAQKGKKALLEAIAEAEKADEPKEDPEDPEDLGNGDGELEDPEEDGILGEEGSEDDEDMDLLNKIVNE